MAKISVECKIATDEDAYVQKFKQGMMAVRPASARERAAQGLHAPCSPRPAALCAAPQVVYAWCQGAKFADICNMTKVFEGSVIRVIRRLEELLRQLALAAKSIGNTELEAKFTDAIVAMKRDIVFAASLYL